MEITDTLYIYDRESWRKWLRDNYKTAKDIWLIYPSKASGKPRIPYNDAVDEALCFGWIDSTVKKTEPESSLQRFSPRRKNSGLSEMNKERIRRMILNGRMTPAGLESIKHHFDNNGNESGEVHFKEFVFPEDILSELRKNPTVWKNYCAFPEYYQRIRIAYIDESRVQPEIFQKRMAYFIKMTLQNKKFGMIK